MIYMDKDSVGMHASGVVQYSLFCHLAGQHKSKFGNTSYPAEKIGEESAVVITYVHNTEEAKIYSSIWETKEFTID